MSAGHCGEPSRRRSLPSTSTFAATTPRAGSARWPCWSRTSSADGSRTRLPEPVGLVRRCLTIQIAGARVAAVYRPHIARATPLEESRGLASEVRLDRRAESARADGNGPGLAIIQPAETARSQSEIAYLRIRDRIVSLDMRPGSVVEEARQRGELEIGRTPIREALQRLALET